VVVLAVAVAALSAAAPGMTSSDGAVAEPRTFYVSTAGSDAGPGTLERPWRTVVRAVRALRPGQRALVRAGTYTERVDVGRSGTASAPIELAAYPGEQPVLAGRLKVTGDHVRVVGLAIDGTGGAAFDAALYIASAEDVEIRSCDIRKSAGSGVFVGDPREPSRNVRLLRNRIHDNGTDDFHDHGIYWAQGTGGVIANNVIDRNIGFGIHLYPDADAVVVRQNTVVGSGRSGIIVAGDRLATADRNLIVNNIVAFNGEFSIRSSWDGATGAGNVVRNNLLFGNAQGDIPPDDYLKGLEIGPGNRVGDPRFVDRDAGNYRLQPASSARDRADAAYSSTRDFDGRRRPQGKRPDIGAFESG